MLNFRTFLIIWGILVRFVEQMTFVNQFVNPDHFEKLFGSAPVEEPISLFTYSTTRTSAAIMSELTIDPERRTNRVNNRLQVVLDRLPKSSTGQPVENEKPNDSAKFPGDQQDDFAQTLNRAQQGDERAIGQLFQISQKYLLLIANQDLNPQVLQKFGASDVVQQSMIVANDKIQQFQGSTQREFFAWMRQILVNECLQATRGFTKVEKRNVDRERSIQSGKNDSVQYQIGDPHLTPSTEAANEEQMQLAARVLSEMEPMDRQVIEMRNWQELTFEEIGRSLGKSSEAARKIWSRAIVKLEKELDKLNAI